MSENYIVINGKRAELTKEQMMQLGIEIEENERWRAEEDGSYCYVNSFNQVEIEWEGHNSYDDFRYYSHNYFKTREEAETYAHVLEIKMLLKKYADEHNGEFKEYRYELGLYNNNNQICVVKNLIISNYSGHPVYFSSRSIAENAIEKIGKNRIIEYLAYEW